MAQHGHSEACCTVPPAVSKGYKEKGKFVDIGGLKTYTTGPSSATSAIFIVYDIFGYSPQALQGADILAHADDKNHQYQVYMPDFFEGKPADHSWYPPDTKEKGEKLGAFFQGPANSPATAERVPKLVKAIREYSPKIEKVGVLGMCWGGKIVSLTSQSGTSFTAAAEVHPAMVDSNDAKGITIPLCMLASKDEDRDTVKKFEEELKVRKHVETFDDQVHGWMAARHVPTREGSPDIANGLCRGDLEDEKVKKEYERGYSILLDFFHKHL